MDGDAGASWGSLVTGAQGVLPFEFCTWAAGAGETGMYSKETEEPGVWNHLFHVLLNHDDQK